MTKYEPKADKNYLRILEEWLKKHPENECSALTVQDLIATIRHAEACLQELEAEIERLKAKCCDDGCRFNQSMKEYSKQLEELTCPTS